ncbi:VTT domain-containing protein [Sporosarcina sp. FSL K6-1540]|uniref:TVP38/TMEM64 family protein n=1 Tax=Sporosarcina sp. FSL K6-1540 TaxID=2921555 RepID=UPI003159E8F7
MNIKLKHCFRGRVSLLHRGKKATIIFLVIMILFFVNLNTDLFRSIISGNIESITSILGDNKAFTLFITFMIMLVHNTFPVIPLFLVILINNTLFGFQLGIVWSILTSILCAIIVFLSIRYVLQDFVLKKVNLSNISKVEQSGLWYVFGARIFPFAPTSIINGVSGVSTIRLSYFIIATALGNITIFFVYTLIQAGLLSQGFNEYVTGIIILSGFIVYYYFKKVTLRKKN